MDHRIRKIGAGAGEALFYKGRAPQRVRKCGVAIAHNRKPLQN